MYQYAQVENALMRVHNMGESARSAFSARIKYFQRLGLLKATPGKGSRIIYKTEDISLIALCLELSQFGIEPKRSALISGQIWKKIHHIIMEDAGSDDMFLACYPYLVTASIEETYSSDDDILWGLMPLDEVSPKWVYSSDEVSRNIRDRAILINLSGLRRRIRNALAES